jgi:hypothetical protein
MQKAATSSSEENKNARTTANPRASARQINAKMGADRPASERIPRLPGFSRAAEFFAAACEVSKDRGTSRVNDALGIPSALNRR